MKFFYQLDIDSGDIARIDVSLDNRLHWINVLDSLPFCFSWPWGMDTPSLTTSSAGWTQFNLRYDAIDCGLPDSFVYFRFTFISDSIDSVKDGWMIDEIGVSYVSEGISKLQNNNLISLYPNPSKGNIYIHPAKQYADTKITVYNTLGQEVYYTESPQPNGYLNLPLPNGTYTLKYAADDEYCVKRIVIAR